MSFMSEDEECTDKIDRVLGLYTRLMSGALINKAAEAKRYNTSERSIQRDIDSIRNYLDETEDNGGIINTVVYDRANKGYRLERMNDTVAQGKTEGKQTPPPIPMSSYHVVIEGQAQGPFTINQIKQMVGNGVIGRSSLVWKEGMPDWVNAANVAEICVFFLES